MSNPQENCEASGRRSERVGRDDISGQHFCSGREILHALKRMFRAPRIQRFREAKLATNRDLAFTFRPVKGQDGQTEFQRHKPDMMHFPVRFLVNDQYS